ncbi:MAG: hypothetical protein ACREOC_11115 [Gemmatimonadales bacterium]
MSRREPLVWLTLAVLIGLLVRAVLVIPHDFPLNDGGLFAAMAGDLRASGFRLPSITSYNAERIPYGYSPLGLYAVALLAEFTGASAVELLRWVPLVATALTVPAFALLARRLVGEGVELVAAVLAFSLIPRSFTWLLMGGGLTRSLGLLFTILGLHQGMLFFAGGRVRHGVGVAVCAALVALSHLGTLPFFALSYGLLLLAYGRTRRAILGSVLAALGAVLLAGPWWLTVVLQHGIEPFLAAQTTGGSAFAEPKGRARVLNALARFGLGTTGEPFFPVILVLAIAGGIALLPARQLLLSAWWVLTLLLDQRAGSTYATLPVAALAGIGAGRVLLPTVSGSRRLRAAAAVALVAYGVGAALVTDPERGGEGRLLTPLPKAQREALAWIARETPPTAEFLVVPDRSWQTDRLAEWFPVLTRRRSVATVQGSEWLAGGEFERRVREYDSLKACTHGSPLCLERWSSRAGQRFTHIVVPRVEPWPCCKPLIAGLAADRSWTLRYEGAGARVYERAALTSAGTRAGSAPPRSSGARRDGRGPE